MWQAVRTMLVLDRFMVQLSAKRDVAADEPKGVWWLRVKWLPPPVAGKKDTLGRLTMGRQKMGRLGQVGGGNFVLLQQLLLEGRNEIDRRADERAIQTRRPSPPGAVKLPIFGRS